MCEQDKQEPMSVRIVDVQMPFGSMVGFMVKWVIAAIPAALILVVLAVVVIGMLKAIS